MPIPHKKKRSALQQKKLETLVFTEMYMKHVPCLFTLTGKESKHQTRERIAFCNRLYESIITGEIKLHTHGKLVNQDNFPVKGLTPLMVLTLLAPPELLDNVLKMHSKDANAIRRGFIAFSEDKVNVLHCALLSRSAEKWDILVNCLIEHNLRWTLQGLIAQRTHIDDHEPMNIHELFSHIQTCSGGCASMHQKLEEATLVSYRNMHELRGHLMVLGSTPYTHFHEG